MSTAPRTQGVLRTGSRIGRPAKRSFAIKGHYTSITIEAPFWDALRDAAAAIGTTPSALVARIDAARGPSGLSSAVRVWLLAYYRSSCEGRAEAGRRVSDGIEAGSTEADPDAPDLNAPARDASERQPQE